MRTRTNIFMGEGVFGFQSFLKGNFPAGNLAIVFDDRELALDVFSKLDIAMYKAKLLALSELNKSLPEHIRFIIGIGSGTVAEKVKKISGGRRFCFYATDMSYQYFSSADTVTGKVYDFAEFVYFDSSKLNVRDTKLLNSAYINVFGVMTESILNSYYESNLPFTDKGLTGIIESSKKLLLEGCDIEKFYSECLRLIKVGVEYLQGRNNNSFFCAAALEKGGLDKEYQFIIDYFVNMIIINFTRWNFSDMLIPAEKLIFGVPSAKPNHRGNQQNILTSKQELSVIAKKVRNLVILPSADSKKIIKLIIDTVTESTPLLAEINNRGILEGMVNYG